MFRAWLGAGIIFMALLGPCGCGKSPPPVEVKPQSALERAKMLLNDYAQGATMASEAMAFDEIVQELRQTDPKKAAILEKGFADIKRTPNNPGPKARELLKQL